MDIGFIGLGNMGQPMARRLIEAGHKLVVYDTRNDAVAPLIAMGAQVASSPADVAELMKKLEAADIAFARVNDWELLSKHAHLRRITVGAPSGPVSMPAPAPMRAGQERTYGPIPALGEHTEMVRKEFLS